MALTHKYTIMCDDQRREDNGKILLIGIYMDSILVPQLPFVLQQMTFFSVFEADRPARVSMRFALQNLESGATLVEGTLQADIREPGNLLAPFKFGPVQFQAVGTYNFILTIEGERDPLIKSFTVALNLPKQQPNR